MINRISDDYEMMVEKIIMNYQIISENRIPLFWDAIMLSGNWHVIITNTFLQIVRISTTSIWNLSAELSD